MRCPNCNNSEYKAGEPCSHCQYIIDTPALTNELSHVNWLLDEVLTWKILNRQSRQWVQSKYNDRKKTLEVNLGLRLPPFTPEESISAWPQLINLESLLKKLEEWQTAGLLDSTPTQPIIEQTTNEIQQLSERLEDYQRPIFPQTDKTRLHQIEYLVEQTNNLNQHHAFVSADAKAQVINPLLAEQESLEIKLGLRPEPTPEPEPIAEEITPPQPTQPAKNIDTRPVKPVVVNPPEPDLPLPPSQPRIPFRERLWQVLLSEKTLQAILFLGTFLLFAAAISFVAWGWKDFSAPLRVAIPTGFTAVFFALGWYVRQKTPMYRSGVALSAIAALLIPIDFYTVYVNFHIPPNYWPLFWLATSVACLVAYILATFIIHNQFFGYLVGVAAGSTVLALVQIGNQAFGLSLDWRSTALSALALGLIILATTLEKASGNTNSVRHAAATALFAPPFRYLSLLSVSVIMLITLGRQFTRPYAIDTLHYALTLNWWLGSIIFAWGAIQYRSRGLGLLAAISLPVATLLTQMAVFQQVGISPAWHAFGWALLVPLYFVVGNNLLAHKNDPVLHGQGRAATGWGMVLLIAAALWSLGHFSEGTAAAATYTVLAGTVAMVALIRQRPAFLYGASLLSFAAVTFAMLELNVTLAQLSVGWVSLAIVHILVAINVGTRFPIPVPNYASPLVVAGYAIAALAVVPTIFPYDGNWLAYALANWLALTAWGARLAHTGQPGFVALHPWRRSLFHWFAAVSLPIWVVVLGDNFNPPDFMLPLTLTTLAWIMLPLSYRLNRVSPIYRWPWYLTGLLTSVVAIFAAFALAPNSYAAAITLVAIGLLYFIDAAINRQSLELTPAGIITALGWTMLLNRLPIPPGATTFGLAGLTAVYFVAGLWVERKKSPIFTRQFLQPLYLTGHFLSLIVLAQITIPILDNIFVNIPWQADIRLWGAASLLTLSGAYALYTWGSAKEIWGHVAAWLLAGSVGLVAITYSTATGSITAELALLAAAFIFVERGLRQLPKRPNFTPRKQAFCRLTWRLFSRPLLVTGWMISAGVIGLALLYNLWWMEAGRPERIWAAVALAIIVALYTLSARLFRQVRFVWLASLLGIAPWTILTSVAELTLQESVPALYAFSWALLAWVLFAVHRTLVRVDLRAYALPPRVVTHILMLLTLGWSVVLFDSSAAGQVAALLLVGLLYFADAALNRQRLGLVPGSVVTAWGMLALVSWLNVPFDAQTFVLALLAGGFIFGGLRVERGRTEGFNRQFMSPLYVTVHVLVLVLLWRVYLRPLDVLISGSAWTDPMKLWGAATQLTLAVVYGVYAWATYKERWAHFAAWLLAFGGAFVAVAFSTGSGSSAAKAALGAIAFVLAERWLRWLWLRGKQEVVRLTWQLYRRPLLITGWVISAAVIAMALVRNLMLLGGGRTQQFWAAVALLLIVGLYALSARLFRQARFMWLSALFIFAPWTILTHLGWMTPYQPNLAQYALSWIVLAWLLLLAGVALDRKNLWAYGLPLKSVANVLVPFSLLWGAADVRVSCVSLGLAVAFYGVAGVLNHRYGSAKTGFWARLWQTKYFYPALGLVPVWCIYLLTWGLPAVQREQYGLVLLVFGPLGLAGGQWLCRIAPKATLRGAYALPAYLVGYTSLAVGTLLVANEPVLLASVLLFDAALMLVSAWLFKSPGWVYPAAVFVPVSLLLVLHDTQTPVSRYGWWLIGLSSVYLVVTWLSRRVGLRAYGTATLAVGFALIALSLPFSSLDRTGALWGFAGAMMLYAITAFWLHQPVLLSLASVLAVVPFVIMVQDSSLLPKYYGLAIWAGGVVAVAAGWLLDRQFGVVKDFPWGEKFEWLGAVVYRLLNWWAFLPYVVGFGLMMVSPLFTQFDQQVLTLDLLLSALVFGWAIYRFRLRIWMVASVVAGQLAVLVYLGSLGLWRSGGSAWFWLGFLPVTVFITLVALFIEHRRGETPVVYAKSKLDGWSHVLYIIVLFDIIFGQLLSLNGTVSAVIVTAVHMGLIAVLASHWVSRKTVYVSISFGFIALTQLLLVLDIPNEGAPVAFAFLALLYGMGGYGLALVRSNLNRQLVLRRWISVWEVPLQRSSIGLSLGVFGLAGLVGIDAIGVSIGIAGLATVRMVIGVLGFLGLLYVIVAYTHKWVRFGYVAIGMLLVAWTLHVFYLQQWNDFRHTQWYIIPFGVYLLGVAYVEWHKNNHTFARWLEYGSLVLMIGVLFWQTMLFGWGFALLLGIEGLACMLWGSGRRLRRFLYVGMVAVVLATVGQLINSLWSINQWIVFGLIGLLLVSLAIIVERKLESIRLWQKILDTWE